MAEGREGASRLAFYRTASGATPLTDFLASLPAKARAKCAFYMARLDQQGLSLPRSYLAKVEGDVWELRPEFGGIEYRLMFGVIAERFVFVHAIVKKRRRLSRADIALAQSRLDELKQLGG
jgi:phage-related protein